MCPHNFFKSSPFLRKNYFSENIVDLHKLATFLLGQKSLERLHSLEDRQRNGLRVLCVQLEGGVSSDKSLEIDA